MSSILFFDFFLKKVSQMDIKKLTKKSFLEFALNMHDMKSLQFAKESMELWDNFYSWEKYPPLCLYHNEDALCYLFYSISKDNKYLIIHRILTPKEFRGKRYAYELLSNLFFDFAKTDIKRFRMSCVYSSLNFYNKIGLNYWGVNDKGQYYCDFKMPKKDIKEIPSIVNRANIDEFTPEEFQLIYKKLEGNGKDFNEEEKIIHNRSLLLMGKRYRYEEILGH